MFERHDVWGEVFHESVGVWVGCSGGKPEEKEEILSRKIRGEGRGLCLKYIYGSSIVGKGHGECRLLLQITLVFDGGGNQYLNVFSSGAAGY